MTTDTEAPVRRKPSRSKNVKASPPTAPPAPLISDGPAQALRIVHHLTTKLGRPPTNHELLGWAKSLRDGAVALETFVQSGGVDVPPPEVPIDPDVEPPAPSQKGRGKRAKGGFRFEEHHRPSVVCEICESPGHSEERCPEMA